MPRRKRRCVCPVGGQTRHHRDVADRFWGIMKHHTTQALFNFWTRKRGRRRAPVRSDIDPADIRHILADTFILTADFVTEIMVRLAGSRVCALFARGRPNARACNWRAGSRDDPGLAWHQTADGARFGHLPASWNCQRYTSRVGPRGASPAARLSRLQRGPLIAHRPARRLTHH